MKIEEYLASLPESILSGQDVQLSNETFREIFNFANLSKNDVFYHLGCGDGRGLIIAKEEFNVKKVIGIDNSKTKIDSANKMLKVKNYSNVELICENIINSNFDDADIILFWFVDENILETIISKGIFIKILIIKMDVSVKTSDKLLRVTKLGLDIPTATRIIKIIVNKIKSLFLINFKIIIYSPLA